MVYGLRRQLRLPLYGIGVVSVARAARTTYARTLNHFNSRGGQRLTVLVSVNSSFAGKLTGPDYLQCIRGAPGHTAWDFATRGFSACRDVTVDWRIRRIDANNRVIKRVCIHVCVCVCVEGAVCERRDGREGIVD